MKPAKGTALAAAMELAGFAHIPLPLMAAGPVGSGQPENASATELKKSSRERAELLQAEAAAQAAEALLSAMKLDLDIRLIGPTSMTGDL